MITEKLAGETSRSAVYLGWVRHRRFVPVSHEFQYPLFMLSIDLDELPTLFEKKWYCSLEKRNIVSFFRKDYFAARQPNLKQAVLAHVNKELGLAVNEPDSLTTVTMLTQPRYFNLVFNPVTFYYCYDKQRSLGAIMAEITNTPWGERHAYVLPVGCSSAGVNYELKGRNKHRFRFNKSFHVSPFNPMDMVYSWVFNDPRSKLHVHMDNLILSPQGESEKHFDATLLLEKKSFQHDLGKSLIQMPLMTVKVVWGIYWQAAKLWFKKAPFYEHPQQTSKTESKDPLG